MTFEKKDLLQHSNFEYQLLVLDRLGRTYTMFIFCSDDKRNLVGQIFTTHEKSFIAIHETYTKVGTISLDSDMLRVLYEV